METAAFKYPDNPDKVPSTPRMMKVKQISISEERILITDSGQWITLYPTHGIIECAGIWNVYNDDLGMTNKDEEYYTLQFVEKDCFLEISLDEPYPEGQNLYTVFVGGWKFYFHDKKDAVKLFNTLVDWKLGRLL